MIWSNGGGWKGKAASGKSDQLGDDLMGGEESPLEKARRQFVEASIAAGRLHNDQYDYWYDPMNPEIFFSVGRAGDMLFSADLCDRLNEDGSAEELFRLIREDHRRRQGGGA